MDVETTAAAARPRKINGRCGASAGRILTVYGFGKERRGRPFRRGAYSALILDEAHERSLNIDFLLGYLQGAAAETRRPQADPS